MASTGPSARLTEIDLCIVMDCTGSMGAYINEAKAKVCEVLNEVETRIAAGKKLRIGFVGYRDFGDADHIVSKDFSADPMVIRDFIGQQRATGGGDAPEDCLGGLERAASLSWGAGINLIVWVGDAPNHGARFHTSKMGDSHLNAPDISDRVLESLSQSRVDIHFVALNDSTDLMYTELARQYDKLRPKRMWKHDMKTSVADFLPTVLKSLRQSVLAR